MQVLNWFRGTTNLTFLVFRFYINFYLNQPGLPRLISFLSFAPTTINIWNTYHYGISYFCSRELLLSLSCHCKNSKLHFIIFLFDEMTDQNNSEYGHFLRSGIPYSSALWSWLATCNEWISILKKNQFNWSRFTHWCLKMKVIALL